MLPGTTATVLSARKTRNVRSADRLPSGNAIVMYLTHGHKHVHIMTMKHCLQLVCTTLANHSYRCNSVILYFLK